MWEKGRQENTIYHKLSLFKLKIRNFGMDMYILRYPKNTILKLHVDKVEGKHYRANVTLKGDSFFMCEKSIFSSKILNVFRPDLYKHGLYVITKTYKLSIGVKI